MVYQAKDDKVIAICSQVSNSIFPWRIYGTTVLKGLTVGTLLQTIIGFPIGMYSKFVLPNWNLFICWKGWNNQMADYYFGLQVFSWEILYMYYSNVSTDANSQEIIFLTLHTYYHQPVDTHTTHYIPISAKYLWYQKDNFQPQLLPLRPSSSLSAKQSSRHWSSGISADRIPSMCTQHVW